MYVHELVVYKSFTALSLAIRVTLLQTCDGVFRRTLNNVAWTSLPLIKLRLQVHREKRLCDTL